MAMTHSHVCYISATGGHERVNLIQKKIWVRGLSFIWEISKSYVCHDALVSVTWFIHMCAMTHSHVCHLSATGGHERVDLIQKERWRRVVPRHTWFIFNTIPQRFRCVPWLPHTCDTYLCDVWHISLWKRALTRRSAAPYLIYILYNTATIQMCSLTPTYVWHISLWKRGLTGRSAAPYLMSHMWMSHGTHVNKSWHICEWVMAHVWMSHGT